MRHPVLSEREGLSKVASRRVVLSVLLSVLAFGLGTGFRPAVTATGNAGPTIIPMVHMDVSEPLAGERMGADHHNQDARPHRAVPEGRHVQQSRDAVSAPASIAPRIPSTTVNFDGVGDGLTGPQGTFAVSSAPPDTNGSVGPNHYFQIVNTDFAIFNKTGTVLYGPVPINTLWSGFGGGCQANNDGDPTVLYDGMADRWLVTQFSVTTTPYLMCVAVSTGPDPTSTYYRYSFSYGTVNFPDYPKLGIWPDGYYLTVNIFANGSTFSGAGVAALDRSRMLSGQAANQQLFTTSTTYGGLLPASLDGSTLPPAGSPNYVVGLGADNTHLAAWKFHVDWSNSSNSTFTGPAAIQVPAFTEACNGGTCIPQSGTSQQLDSLADRLMYRLAYRNRGGVESLVTNQSVTAGSSVGVRWYELRIAAGSPTLFQQGTYAPDSSFRWMGSAAMDQAGDIGLGFSVSSSSLHPGIRYTGRLAADAAGTMSQGESTIITGAGSQTGSGLARWGDYSSMSIDPTDDCTFWYTNEYIPTNGAFNWKTRIASFKFPSCGPAVSDFSISASPSTLSLVQGAAGTSTISTATISGTAQAVNLTVSGAPSGATASLSPTSVTSGGSSTLTVNAGTAVAGTYTLTVTGTGTTTHTTTVSLMVTAPPPPNDFSISASPSSLSLVQGASGTSTIGTTTTSGTAQTVNLIVSGAPGGATASLSPTSVTSGGSSTLTVSAGTAAAGTYMLTVTGTGANANHSTTVSLTVTAPPPPNDFSISASPSSLSLVQGASGTSTISTAITSGSAQTVNLSVSGAPSGATASLSPASVTSGSASTLTVNAGSAAAGTYTLTVTGAGTSATHATSVSVTVAAGAGILNGGFETGNLSGWAAAGTTATSTVAHGGTYSAMVGGSSPTTGDSSIVQTFTPPNSGTLSFFYKLVCPDTLTYDWATATLKDNSTGVTSTVLPRTCTNVNAWANVTAGVTGSHSYTLTLTSHDDNYPGDPTYTLFDDVTLGATPPPPPPGPNVIVNGGFEAGNLSGWAGTGTSAISTAAHSGTYSAMVGGSSPTSGDSTIAQTFVAGSPGGTLSFYYKVICPDTITYDWATATLKDNTTGITQTILAKTCTNNNTWVNVSATLTASHSYTLTLISHDDNWPGDATYTRFDDVAVQ
jgi:hypothetical protein